MSPDEYHKMAEVEDAMWYYRALHRHVTRSLSRPLGSAARVLDAGCGTGGLLRRLHEAQPAWRLTGLDFFPLACDLARERTGGEIVPGSVAALPFADATFDAVTSCDVVCQVADPAAAVREFHRVLRPGGVLVLTMPAYGWMYSYHDREVGNLRRSSRGEVNALLRAAGFAITASTYWNMLPFPLAVLRRKIFPPARPASDVGLFPAPVETFFHGLMALEHGWLGLGMSLPFGNSVLTVARKS
ncbi:MAG: class I SAM-dependent methyltransferase [Lacunisphaera sp.]|nr:class I SAM-dependent methyltransferase [Lacunisphaera sp.]